MPYALQADMTARYPLDELIARTNLDDPGATAIAPQVLDRALDDASAEMDRYFEPTALPLELDTLTASSRADLTLICCRIARKNLYFDAPSGDAQWRIEYEDAIRALEAHQARKANLLRLAVAPSGATQIRTAGNARTFNRRRLRDL